MQPPGRGVGTYRALCLAGPLVAVEALGRSFELGTLSTHMLLHSGVALCPDLRLGVSTYSFFLSLLLLSPLPPLF